MTFVSKVTIWGSGLLQKMLWTGLFPPSPHSQAFAAVVLQSKVWMDANACAGICVTRSIMSALILPSGESRRSPPDIFRSADESAGYILQSERPYERWGRAAGRSSDRHCTKDPYCPNCSLLQENLLNGSCRCFLLFFSSLSPHIFTTTATVFVVDVFFFFLFLKCFLFFLSLVWTLFFFPCPWVCWETGGIMFTLVAWLKTLKGTMAIMWRLIKGLDFLFLFFLPWWDLM